jgi:hypothetical protein
MFWNFFKNRNKKNNHLKIGVDNSNDIGIMNKEDKNLFSLLEYHNQVKPIEKQIEVIDNRVDYKIENEGVSMKFLVVLDTSNVSDQIRQESGGTLRGLSKGLHNFYIVEAHDAQKAKDVVMWTFRRSPVHLQTQIGYSLKATPLKNILDSMNGDYIIWSYVSPKGTVRQPGQQVKIQQQQINPNNPDEVLPITSPPPPPLVARDDTPKMEKKENPITQVDPNNPMASMAAMFTQMQKMMEQIASNTNIPNKNNLPEYRKVENPEDDPELVRRMQSVLRESTQTKRSVGEADENDEMLKNAERIARMEVENFKNLSPEQQVSKGSLDIDLNDNNDIDQQNFKRMVNRNTQDD